MESAAEVYQNCIEWLIRSLGNCTVPCLHEKDFMTRVCLEAIQVIADGAYRGKAGGI